MDERTEPHPLVISADDGLVDELLHLLAAAGTTPELTHGGAALRRAHRSAPLVVLGADVLGAAAVRALPRRPGVVVASREELTGEGFEAALAVGAERVVVLPRDEGWLVERAARAVRDPVDPGALVVVSGACGGAGASTLATALALGLPGERATVLVDTDPAGGGLDLLLGAEWAEGLRWPDLAGLRGRVDGAAVVASLPRTHGVHVLAPSREVAGPVPPGALAAVVEAARADGHPVVVDLPHRPDPAVAEQVLADADLAVLVVPGRVRALAAAGTLLRDPVWGRAALVARTTPGGVGAAEVATALGRPVVAELVHDRSAPARAERGEPPQVGARTPLGQVVRRLLPRVGAGSVARA
ncbi:septum site-determining protein Ssd [Klenkia terrae]|uniref:Septum site-determining protein Ssd n=1 Tax=Klenkia terrae TaxID=1052259 RepID=A0ABU8E0E4_9ACTN|nr:septum site-determining protein Ssd [Klenkia terrae]